MSVADDLELPIAPIRVSGATVDAMENRKECGFPIGITEEQLRQNYESVREATLAGLKMLATTPIRTR